KTSEKSLRSGREIGVESQGLCILRKEDLSRIDSHYSLCQWLWAQERPWTLEQLTKVAALAFAPTPRREVIMTLDLAARASQKAVAVLCTAGLEAVRKNNPALFLYMDSSTVRSFTESTLWCTVDRAI